MAKILIIEDEKNAIEAQDKLRNIKIGSIIQGTVKNITSYGVFVTLFPTIEGLIHISEISWNRIKTPADVLKVGDEVNVVITNIDFDKKRVSLSMKQLIERPEEGIPELQSDDEAAEEAEAPAEETAE